MTHTCRDFRNHSQPKIKVIQPSFPPWTYKGKCKWLERETERTMKKIKCFILSEGKYYDIQAALSQSPFFWGDFCWTQRALYSFLTCDRKNNLVDCLTLTSWVTLFGRKTQALHLRVRGREQGVRNTLQGRTSTSGSPPISKSLTLFSSGSLFLTPQSTCEGSEKLGEGSWLPLHRMWLAHYSGHICGRGTVIRKGGILSKAGFRSQRSPASGPGNRRI